jgi:prepilin-type N-terminal cleavage/methylation domain-containing protein
MKHQVLIRKAKGFSLVELLIVVIIMAILAAIVVPSFGNSAQEARESALNANLAAMRSAIEVYRAQHINRLPGTVATNGTVAGDICPAGQRGTATQAGSAAFIEQLTKASDAFGNTCAVADLNIYRFGPYIRNGMPKEPITDSAAVTIFTDAAPIAPAAGAQGWAFNTQTGQFAANTTLQGMDSKPLSSR